MKRYLKQLICALAILCLAAGFAPVQAEAATTIKGQYRLHTIEQKKWYTYNYSEKYQDYYKFTVPSTGYIKLDQDTSKTTSHHNAPRLSIETNYTEGGIRTMNVYDDTSYIALPKGTYYIYASHDKMRFKYQFVKQSRTSNYCMAKAEALKAGKNKMLVFDYGYEFTKWYKVDLTKSKRIRIWAASKDGYGDFTPIVIDKDGEMYDVTFLYANKSQTEVLPKGTYYILLSRDLQANRRHHRNAKGYYVERTVSFTWNAY
ncbi:MAG: hypothetical protein IJH81_10395 [Lachnospiraceae bacterium]|nr:hypothetical protein [Lachnospiraceae bacterium]